MTNTQSWNRYSYVSNNPINYNDPTGHKEAGECGYMGEQCWDDSDGPIEEDVEESAKLPDWLRRIVNSIIPSGVGFEFETSAGSLLPVPAITQAQSSTELVYLWETPNEIYVVKSRAWFYEGGDTYKFRIGLPSFYVSFSVGLNLFFHTSPGDLGGYDKTKGMASGPLPVYRAKQPLREWLHRNIQWQDARWAV